ncbi:hypothetical protein [Streptomyces flaveolus]|uniref:hypothetical protein n=1 Tax=Streptomyces flaveolus TaxID=67297 RepID=UPI0036FBD3A7
MTATPPAVPIPRGLPATWVITVPTRRILDGRIIHATRTWIVEAFDHAHALKQATALVQTVLDLITGPPAIRPLGA